MVSDPRNAVYVVSGDAQENVENAIGHIAGLGLAASNGALFSNPVQPGESRRTWQSFDLGVDFDAVKRVRFCISQFSFIQCFYHRAINFNLFFWVVATFITGFSSCLIKVHGTHKWIVRQADTL